jgi:hypothetical protein
VGQENAVVDTIGGYRLIRTLGTGRCADVWLGHPGTIGSGAETVAIKVYRSGTAAARIDTEIEALARASDRHLLRLEDLSTASDGPPSLILQRLSTVSLGALVSSGPLPVGEAVTVLAPLTLAVAELHRVGVTHGAIRPSAVLFDAEGGPVLARFGSAGLVGDFPASADSASLPPARLAVEPGVVADLAQLIGTCRAALGPDAGELRGWLDGVDVANPAELADPQGWTHELADRLFRCAQARPVRFERRPSERPPAAVPPRLGGEDPSAAALELADPVPASPVREAVSLLHLPEALLRPLADRFGPVLEAGPITTLISKARQVLAPVRRPVWIIAGIVTVAVIASIVLLPGPSSGSAPSGPSEPGSAAAPGVVPSVAPNVVPRAADADIAAEDPIRAAEALLAARTACLSELSILCLDGVDQAGSAAMEADSYRIRVMQEQGVATEEPELAGARVNLVERLGDSALLSAEPSDGAGASLLLVRTEQGWRLRDLVFADDAVAGEAPSGASP